uniref:Uncharacterized protein n=1 Tax=Rhodnius prolixus TaxID=13249 RepID=T1HR88_RHOPR
MAVVVQEHIQSGGFLPFGVTLLFSGWYDCKQTLFQCDPSVAYYAWKAIAIGKNYSNETTFLEISQEYIVHIRSASYGGWRSVKNV